MEDKLDLIQLHLWLVTGMIVLILISNVLCNLATTKEKRAHDRLRRLWELEKYAELHAITSKELARSPNASTYLMHHVLALVGIGRLSEAREAALKFKKVAPTLRSEAMSMIASIDDMLESEA
jgi:hypothetical protein